MTTSLSHDRLSPLLPFFGSSFVFHMLWENLQAPLFEGYTSFGQHFWVCFRAAATGDMLFMLTIYLALAVIHRNGCWVKHRSSYDHPATWILTLLLGILLAISFELWAVEVDHRWQYAASMPTIPIVNIGLTPILQMIIVPFLTLLLTFRFSQRS